MTAACSSKTFGERWRMKFQNPDHEGRDKTPPTAAARADPCRPRCGMTANKSMRHPSILLPPVCATGTAPAPSPPPTWLLAGNTARQMARSPSHEALELNSSLELLSSQGDVTACRTLVRRAPHAPGFLRHVE